MCDAKEADAAAGTCSMVGRRAGSASKQAAMSSAYGLGVPAGTSGRLPALIAGSTALSCTQSN